MISVGIIEDDQLLRERLVSFLNSQREFQCVIDTNSVESFLKNSNPFNPIDIILLDIGLPGMNGIEGIRYIKTKHLEADIVMITIYDDNDNIFKALRNGAIGYLLKNTPPKELKQLLLTIKDGGSPMSPAIARKIIEYFNPPTARKNEFLLTSKEQQVAQCLTEGLSYKMVADQLNITLNTVRDHVRHIYKKLHVNSKMEVLVKLNKRRI